MTTNWNNTAPVISNLVGMQHEKARANYSAVPNFAYHGIEAGQAPELPKVAKPSKTSKREFQILRDFPSLLSIYHG